MRQSTNGVNSLRGFGLDKQLTRLKVKIKIVDLYSASIRIVSRALRCNTHCQGITQLYLHTLRFIRKRNESYLSLPSQPRLVLICRPQRDGRLSRPWCEVAQAEIRTRNLSIANQTLYHITTSAPFSLSLRRLDFRIIVGQQLLTT